MQKIIIVSKNKGIVPKEDLIEFAKGLKKSTGLPIDFYTPSVLGTQVTFHDVIEVYIILERLSKTDAGKHVQARIKEIVLKIKESYVLWAKNKLNQEQTKRPKSLLIKNETGEKIQSITVTTKGQIEDTTKESLPYKELPPEDSQPFFHEDEENGNKESNE